MTEQEILDRMVEASKEDRERFFAVADTLYLQPKYKEKLEELEEIKQQWRDITKIADYPNIDFPLTLPEWFPKIHFASKWDKDYLVKTLESYNKYKTD